MGYVVILRGKACQELLGFPVIFEGFSAFWFGRTEITRRCVSNALGGLRSGQAPECGSVLRSLADACGIANASQDGQRRQPASNRQRRTCRQRRISVRRQAHADYRLKLDIELVWFSAFGRFFRDAWTLIAVSPCLAETCEVEDMGLEPMTSCMPCSCRAIAAFLLQNERFPAV